VNPTLMTVLAVAVAWSIAWLATSTSSVGARRRTDQRRRRYVARHPRQVNRLDVERRLADELSGAQAAFVADRIEHEDLDSRTVWSWLDRFGAAALLLAVASGHGRGDVCRLLDADGPLDTDQMSVLARLAVPDLFGVAEASDARANL
jgi:hypothetical protein